MYVVLKKGRLKTIIAKAIQKAGTIRKLGKIVDLPKSTIYNYFLKDSAIPIKNLDKLKDYLGEKILETDIEKKLEDNWKQIQGGIKCVEKKRNEGTLKNQLAKSREHINHRGDLKLWHKKMKAENPEQYYKTQYEHFKKVGNYKETTKNNEKVRNILEKEIADLLYNLKIPYEYEPLIKVDNHYFFPDFLVKNKIIIECTMWRGYDKAFKLEEKIKYLKKNYKVYVIIPKKLEKYYKLIKSNLILDSEELIKLLKDL
jgi:hypothetical protein